jgi:hypothetical protein
MRAYHRVDPLMDERKSDYTPAQFGAFLKVQLLAGRQGQRGAFRSRQALVGALPSAYARHVPFLVERRDLVERADGTLYVDGWEEWQEGDLTVRERMARLRNRHRNNGRNGAVSQPSPTANATESLSLGGSKTRSGVGNSVGSSLSDGEQREHLDRLKADMEAKGVPLPAQAMKAPPGGTQPEDDAERLARYREIAEDEDEPEWRRVAARSHLGLAQ